MLDQGGQDILVLDISAASEAVVSGVVQRTYARGIQRSIAGFSTRSAVGLTLQSLAQFGQEWLRERTGQQVTLRDTRGGRWDVVIGDISYDTDPGFDESTVYDADLQLFYARERN